MFSKKLTNSSIVLGLAFLVSACSSHIPPEIRQSVEGAPTLSQVRQQLDDHQSTRVRWGGVILETENKQNSSEVTIIAFPLSSRGEPRVSDNSQGRFVALVDEFLEPLVFSRDREITVTGTVLKSQTGKVGDYDYQYPVIAVEHYYLWPPKAEIDDDDYPPFWWYDPWYRPYYPYYPYYPRYIVPHIPHRPNQD